MTLPIVDGTGRGRRIARRRAARARELNEGIFGLNVLAGYGQALDGKCSTSQNSDPAKPPSPLQAAAVEDRSLLVERDLGPCPCGREASFRETLQGRAGYPDDTA